MMAEYEPTTPFDYTTLAAVKAHIPEGDVAKDVVIEALIPRASRYIDRYKRVPESFYRNGDAYAVADIHYYDGNGKVKLWIDYCTEIEQVRVRNTTWAIWTENTDFVCWPYNTEALTRLDIRELGSQTVWTSGQRNVEVTAKWGRYANTPPEVEEACIIIIARLLERGSMIFRDVGAIMELGRLVYTQPMDPEAKAILDGVPGRLTVG